MTAAHDEEPWVAEYRRAMTDFLLKHGTLVDPSGGNQYSWGADDYDHPRDCPLSLSEGGTFREGTITEFLSTFDGNRDRSVIDICPVHCACGAITDRTVRYDGTTGDLFNKFLGGLNSPS